MHLGRDRRRRALRQIGEDLRHQDPLLAVMLTGSDELSGGQHPENGRARRRKAAQSNPRRSSYTPFVMF